MSSNEHHGTPHGDVACISSCLWQVQHTTAEHPKVRAINCTLCRDKTCGTSSIIREVRKRDHDDLVLAVAMAAWMGELIGKRVATCDRDIVLWPTRATA